MKDAILHLQLPIVYLIWGLLRHCWMLRQIAGEARNMMENSLSILSVIFSVQLQPTEISERKLFIFHLGIGKSGYQ